MSPHSEMEREIPFLCPRSPLSSVSWRLSKGPVHLGHKAEGSASPRPSSPPAPSPAGSPGALGTDCGPSSSARPPRLKRCPARQAQVAAMSAYAAQPLSLAVTGTVCSVPSLFFPGRARRAGAPKPWKQHGPPVPPQLSPLPGFFLSLCGPPGVLALPQALAPARPGTSTGPMQREPRGFWHSWVPSPAPIMHRMQALRTPSSAVCPPFSSHSPLGLRNKASSGKCSLFSAPPTGNKLSRKVVSSPLH